MNLFNLFDIRNSNSEFKKRNEPSTRIYIKNIRAFDAD